MIWRIAITGPESTGKSMLSEQLAAHYNTVWVPEFARAYLADLNRSYKEEDIVYIAQQQLLNEERHSTVANRFLFCDTEFIVTKIWSDVKYGHCDPWILRTIENHRYDLFLLCDIDLPWEYDPQREHPDKRKFLFDLYLHELIVRNFPFFVVRGLGPERLNQAVKKIDNFPF
ncbi:MAG: ATP-binding protein [Bacteroidales bacterium]|nr:ATP-binding protein [Bacteroidales bacterium]